MSTTYENVKNWILKSGLVITETENENYGAVHSFYDENSEKYGFLYPEITGYNVSALCFLHQVEKSDLYIKMAKASANWLIGIFEKYGAVIQGLDDENESKKQLAHSFDTAICAKGLLDCYKITQEDRFLKHSKELVQWMKKSLTDKGKVLPYFKIKSNEFVESNNLWYKKWGCFHIKTSIPFIQLYHITKDTSYLDDAIKICNTFSKFQNNDGSFSLHENVKTINLHTMSYALEGLLFTYSITKDEKYLQSVGKALDWSANQIAEDGSINLWFNSKYKSKAIYPLAQIIRLMILMDKFQNTNKFLKNILKLRTFMTGLQVNNGSQKINGGFYEEYYKTLFGWKKRKKVNSWGSLFGLQALYWYDNFEKINFEESISNLY